MSTILQRIHFLTSTLRCHHHLTCYKLHNRRMVSFVISLQVIPKKQEFLGPKGSLLINNKQYTHGAPIFSPILGACYSTQRLIYNKEVFIGDFNSDSYNENDLKELFSKFGKITKIYKSPRSRLNQSFAIVTFLEDESVEKALFAKTITTPHGDKLFIQRSQSTSTKLEARRTYAILGLPKAISASQVHDYFKTFCDVELVHLHLNLTSDIICSNALITFKRQFDTILGQRHVIGNSSLTIRKVPVSLKITGKERRSCENILVEGLPFDIMKKDISSYFKAFGVVKNVAIPVCKETGRKKGVALVNFDSQRSALSAGQNVVHEICGTSVNVRVLGYVSEE